ncbi:E3 ubiquitin-protein ligase TRIM56 [Holothuria leucospilota]|uniref:E3 ubiquitin-protein ligase TRIM56 n=1 Tax=Holothuria leucospilota TaxID=206669 RepID=A0A9Q1BTY3_HOLLE|nr:E3 ubiquitin-protein ligase TRIM56 [Holothuria leucospilota]
MASSGSDREHLIEIDEKFCECSICLQQYKEPKLLPCLHRYCSDCLKKLIERSQGASTISYPECRDDFKIPKGGIADFKTDYYMKNIIEYIQLQKSLENKQMRHCCNNLKKVKVTAYCFKCKDFLCQECYKIHLTKKMMKDHKQHTFSFDDIKSKNLTLEKLSLLKEAPRCKSHPEDLCRLCCRTCNNMPICVNCTYGSHEDHNIKEVPMLAAQEREALRVQLSNLGQSRERIYEMAETVDRVRKELVSDVKKKKETFKTKHEWNIKKIKTEMRNMEESNKIKEAEIEKVKEKDLMEKRKQMEKEISEVKSKYDNICDEIMNDSKMKLSNLKQQHEKDLDESKQRASNLESDLNQFITAIEERLDEMLEKLYEISQKIDSTTKRFENLTATASFILETKNYWTTVQCIPDIQTAIGPLNADMKIAFPELERMSCVYIWAQIKENEDSPVSIDGIETTSWWTDSITGSNNGSIFIAGWDGDCDVSRICHINITGDVLRQMAIKSSQPFDRYCAFLSRHKVATICTPHEIGVYDVRDETYVSKKISDIISIWLPCFKVKCVATDPVHNHILVTWGGMFVHVLDHHLHFLHTLTLPRMIGWVNNMTVNEGNLIVCSDFKKAAYVVTMERFESKLLHELPKPGLGKDDWKPIGVCTSRSGYIYLLWQRKEDAETNVCLVQYCPFNYQLLIEKMVDRNSYCLTTVEINKTEKLLIATSLSKQLFVYDLRSLCIL